MVGFNELANNKHDDVTYCLMDCIKDNYIGDPEKDIELYVAQALFNELGVKGGMGLYVDWVSKYYGGNYQGCKNTFENLKKEKGKDRLTIDFIVKLAKPYDEDNRLIVPVTDQEQYQEMKTEFEKSHFQAADVFYQVYNKSLRQFNKVSFNVKYQHLKYGKDNERFLNTWLDDPEKRMYERVDFLPPPLEVPDDVFNTWDIAVEDREDRDDMEEDSEVNTSIIHKFITKLSNCGDEGYDYLMKYVSHILKHPAIKPEVGILFTSSQGSGKDTFYKLLRLLTGDGFITIDSQPEDVFGKYNIDTRLNKLIVILQEADNLRNYTGPIKDLITCKTAKLANKGVKQVVTNDYSRLLIFSNNDNILKIEPQDRRFVIFSCWDFYIDKDPEFFNELHSALDNPSVIKKFRQELMNYDVPINYNFQLNRPVTDKYADLKAVNTPAIIRWAHTFCKVDFIDETDGEGREGGEEEEVKIKSGDLCASYNTWCKMNFENSKDTNMVQFGLLIKKYFCINNVWRGFVRKHTRYGNVFTIDKDVLTMIVTEKYGYNENL